MPKLTITIDVPDGMYCGYQGIPGKKCHMCFKKTNGDFICAAYWVRLYSDVSGPLKYELCDKLTDTIKGRG